VNVFVLDLDPSRAAVAQCDAHVVKMPVETAQILSTVVSDLGLPAPYRPTHRHHPCVRWAAARAANFEWLLAHGFSLCDEFLFRYGHEHGSRRALERLALVGIDAFLPSGERTPFVQAVPDDLRGPDPVVAYRATYRREKARFARWAKGRPAPEWWQAA
jgi:hypothetical protein